MKVQYERAKKAAKDFGRYWVEVVRVSPWLVPFVLFCVVMAFVSSR